MNMSYCRFQNTASDLADCAENLASLNPEHFDQNTHDEREARKELILTCARILQKIGVEDPWDEFEILACVEQLDADYEPEVDEL